MTLAECVREVAILDAWAAGDRDDEALISSLAQMPDDMIAHLLPLVDGDRDRWLRVGRVLSRRTPVLGHVAAVMSVHDELLAGTL